MTTGAAGRILNFANSQKIGLTEGYVNYHEDERAHSQHDKKAEVTQKKGNDQGKT